MLNDNDRARFLFCQLAGHCIKRFTRGAADGLPVPSDRPIANRVRFERRLLEVLRSVCSRYSPQSSCSITGTRQGYPPCIWAFVGLVGRPDQATRVRRSSRVSFSLSLGKWQSPFASGSIRYPIVQPWARFVWPSCRRSLASIYAHDDALSLTFGRSTFNFPGQSAIRRGTDSNK